MKSPNGGNGVKIRVTKNGSKIWPASGGFQSIGGADSVGVAVVINESVSANDMIRFEVDPDGANDLDYLSWIPSIYLDSN